MAVVQANIEKEIYHEEHEEHEGIWPPAKQGGKKDEKAVQRL